MALVTVIKFVLTWAFANFLFIMLTPIIKTVRYDTGNWNLLPSDMVAWGDQLYVLWIAQLVIVPAIVIITAWREAEAKAAGLQ